MFSSQALFGRKPYGTVCLNGWTLDEKGEKMSKSLGNVILAGQAHNDLGADMLRLYYCWDIAPWETQKFSMRSARELKRVMEVLWNSAQFVEKYSDKSLHGKRPGGMMPEDEWMISKLNSTVKNATEDIENFRLHHYGRGVSDFMLNDFSRWYIKLIRGRVSPWHEGKDKEAAQIILLDTLETTLKLLAPIMPFITESIYQRLFAKSSGDSIHNAAWPKPGKIDTEGEEGMAAVMSLVEAMNADRDEKKIKLKWPVSEVVVCPKDRKHSKTFSHFAGAVKSIANVENVLLDEKLTEGREFEFGKFRLGKVLEDKALLRELTREIQIARKKKGLLVTEKVALTIQAGEKAAESLKKLENELAFAVGAGNVKFESVLNPEGTLNYEGRKISFAFRKL
jgi:isoleucyl-tRNA synthetase